MIPIRDNIERIRERIANAAHRAGRDPATVKLMAVTKTVDDERIQAAIDAGITLFGENYVQEAKRKIEVMGRDVSWHMIGHLQSNKAKYAVNLFNMVHSVDRMSLATELNRRAANAGITMDILVEVNVSGEESKEGIPRDGAIELVENVATLDNLALRGLMTMPPWFDNPEDARPYFIRLRELRNEIIAKNIPGVAMTELSMGMSGDFEVAVEEGATIVRIGTAVFGPRK